MNSGVEGIEVARRLSKILYDKVIDENIKLDFYSKVLTHSDMRTSTKFNRYDLLPVKSAAQSNIAVGELKYKFLKANQYNCFLLRDNVESVVSQTKEIHKIYQREDYKPQNIEDFIIHDDIAKININVAAHGIGAQKDGLQKFRTHFFVGDTLHFLIDEVNKSIYILLERYNGGSRQEFSEFVYGVIDRISGDSSVQLSETDDFFDTFFDKGVGDIEGPIWIKVLFFPGSITDNEVYLNWDDLSTRISSFSSNVLIISNREVPQSIILPSNCIIWGFQKIIELQKNYPIEYGVAYPKMVIYKTDGEKLGKKQTSAATIIKEKYFTVLSEDHYKKVKEIAEIKSDFAIVLGAGVSQDIGAKSWDGLIKEFENNYSDDFSKVDVIKEKIGKSNLIAAQLFKDKDKYYKSFDNMGDRRFFQILRNALYKEIALNFSDKTKTLYYIAQYIKKKENTRNFRVLTYNFDDFLEQYLDNLNLQYKSVFVNDNKINECIPIYHAHGFLPSDENNQEEKHLNSIRLTEEDYNLLFNSPYSWEIVSQLMFFREKQCLFIGHSITDPNIRRLLEIAHKEGNKHYVVFARSTILQAIDMFWIVYHFKRIGINIIWTDSFATYPKTIQKLLK